MDNLINNPRRGRGETIFPSSLPLRSNGLSSSQNSSVDFHHQSTNQSSNGNTSNDPWWKSWMKKYVVLCFICGGLSVILGIIFIIIYLLFRSSTSSLHYFETIPTYVPGIVLIITGLIITCFTKRKNRFTYLIKIAGGCCLICALLCIIITITTTVLHMNRLQTLHECVYTPQEKKCMCVSSVVDHGTQDAHRFIFNHTPNCEVVHGSLYSCLRALFSFSVIGILICIFSSMLVYQLLSHEKKRIYWEQLELRRRFLYQRHSHHTICGCYEDLYPWQFWEMLDYRILTTHNLSDRCPILNEGDDVPPQGNTFLRNEHNTNRNWFPWNRHNLNQQNRNDTNISNCIPIRQNFVRRLLSREDWNQRFPFQEQNSSENNSVQNDTLSLPWRSECIHIFRPNHRNSCAPHVRFGIRSRNSPYNRHYSNHRRTRSNDGVFHHLHMNPMPRFVHPYPITEDNIRISCNFNNFDIPQHMWGPPPPYSQSPSIENISGCDDRNIRTLRRSESGLQQISQNLDLTTLELQTANNNSVPSKVNSPISERRFLCHNFSSENITLTIENNFSSDLSGITHESKQEETCIVEVHVPYIFQKRNIVFNTLPTRSCRKHDNTLFKSLSNIPSDISHKFNTLKRSKKDEDNLSVIKLCELKEKMGYSWTRINNVGNIEPPLSDPLILQSASLQHNNDSINNSLISNMSPSFISYHPTLVEIPSDFRTNFLIATSPSTPVTETVKFPQTIHAQSMPNLSVSNSPLICHFRRVPSSGNTSTSQDFADFEFEEDSSPLVLCSPVSDIPQLPDDNASENSCLYLSCHQNFQGVRSSEVAFSNYSSTSSCDALNGTSDQNSMTSIVCNTTTVSNDVLNYGSDKECKKCERSHKLPPTSSIILCERPLVNCSVNCNIHHLHRYHHTKKTSQFNEQVRDGHLRSASCEQTNFIVTIKSVNV